MPRTPAPLPPLRSCSEAAQSTRRAVPATARPGATTGGAPPYVMRITRGCTRHGFKPAPYKAGMAQPIIIDQDVIGAAVFAAGCFRFAPTCHRTMGGISREYRRTMVGISVEGLANPGHPNGVHHPYAGGILLWQGDAEFLANLPGQEVRDLGVPWHRCCLPIRGIAPDRVLPALPEQLAAMPP